MLADKMCVAIELLLLFKRLMLMLLVTNSLGALLVCDFVIASNECSSLKDGV